MCPREAQKRGEKSLERDRKNAFSKETLGVYSVSREKSQRVVVGKDKGGIEQGPGDIFMGNRIPRKYPGNHCGKGL